MVEVKKKDDESFESLRRRFNRKVQQSGILIRARKNQYRDKPKSKNIQRRNAVRRSKISEEKEELRQMGRLPQRPYYRSGR